ncbi:hypothetical protein FOCC_FOCC002255 [Frankliniella occidentalis]|nr:hypothetical protein FOCC_FOCC002255 [Frankliniella occidentalis]
MDLLEGVMGGNAEVAFGIADVRMKNVRTPVQMARKWISIEKRRFIWSHDKITIDSERIAAIKVIAEPRNKKELQRALGGFNNLRRFIPQIAEISAPLCNLLSNAVQLSWLPVHATAFQSLKDSDSTKGLVVQADASQSGLGCCLLQQGRPVSTSSRKLTSTEQSYEQIEKETSALVYAGEKSNKIIYGRPNVIFQTDHQPLLSIFKKPIHQITNNRLKSTVLSCCNIPLKFLTARVFEVLKLFFCDDLPKYSLSEQRSGSTSSGHLKRTLDNPMCADYQDYQSYKQARSRKTAPKEDDHKTANVTKNAPKKKVQSPQLHDRITKEIQETTPKKAHLAKLDSGE